VYLLELLKLPDMKEGQVDLRSVVGVTVAPAVAGDVLAIRVMVEMEITVVVLLEAMAMETQQAGEPVLRIHQLTAGLEALAVE
jgi:hypothetical protein